ncbi:uncharacterized protein LOC128229916 isoform X2 [Mya arenaria]|uniref:uncharacterized protein LOC128229916 isoform X2 n=1 Tax=Mya arenaria TaxID=6604 RepID=UPI0022E775BF|nr:uncharacterized protein LOC128229916 isoform X2 [Mya arenaria]
MGIIKLFFLLITFQSLEGNNIWKRDDVYDDDLLSFFNERAPRHMNPDAPMDISDPKHGVKMGVPTRWCDDGVHGIEIDWDPNSSVEYTCQPGEKGTSLQGKGQSNDYKTIYTKAPEKIMHACLNETLDYESPIPTSGNHRPLWPVFGEYKYLPPQRYAHALEHGAIALLYNPCLAKPEVVNRLKTIVTGCNWKHVITPYKKIPGGRAYAVLAYENAYLLPNYESADEDMTKVIEFIKAHGLKGPEANTSQNGQYSAGIIEPAIPGNNALCPGL